VVKRTRSITAAEPAFRDRVVVNPLSIIGALSATPSTGSQQRKEDGEGAPQHCEDLLWGYLGPGIVWHTFELDVVLLCVANERIEQALA
jgi:hypothetical protein